MEIKIGEIFDHSIMGQITAKKSDTCDGCIFAGINCSKEQGYCSRIDRTDNNSVIFVKIEPEIFPIEGFTKKIEELNTEVKIFYQDIRVLLFNQ